MCIHIVAKLTTFTATTMSSFSYSFSGEYSVAMVIDSYPDVTAVGRQFAGSCGGGW